MPLQRRVVGADEAQNIIRATGAILAKQAPGRVIYWSPKLNTYITITKQDPVTYKVEWDGTADCGC